MDDPRYRPPRPDHVGYLRIALGVLLAAVVVVVIVIASVNRLGGWL